MHSIPSPLLFSAFNATRVSSVTGSCETQDFTDRVELISRVYIIIRTLARAQTPEVERRS